MFEESWRELRTPTRQKSILLGRHGREVEYQSLAELTRERQMLLVMVFHLGGADVLSNEHLMTHDGRNGGPGRR